MRADPWFLVRQKNTQRSGDQSRIVGLAPFFGDAPVKDKTEVLDQFAGTFRLGVPDRAKDLMNIVDGNLGNRQFSQFGKGVAGDQGVSLFAVFGVGDGLGLHRIRGFKGCCKGALAGFLGGFATGAFERDGVLAL